MKKIITWIKTHFLNFILILTILFLLLKNSSIDLIQSSKQTSSYSPSYSTNRRSFISEETSDSIILPEAGGGIENPILKSDSFQNDSDRMIIKTSNLSLLVKNVSQSLKDINDYVSQIGGFMVDQNLNRPEESASGRITIRIPADKLDQTIQKLQSLSTKVVSQTLYGKDVTDEYVDNEERLKILQNNKTRLEEIMQKAEKVEDILEVQRQIFNLQSQIEIIKGDQEYLKKTAQMAKITIYLSEDEYSLPYVPEGKWRPQVIFKSAVRSLVKTSRAFASLAIWLFVYSVIILPVVFIIRFVKKRKNKIK